MKIGHFFKQYTVLKLSIYYQHLNLFQDVLLRRKRMAQILKKESGCLLNDFKALISHTGNADITILREIITITTNRINSLSYSPTNPPPEPEGLEKLLDYIPDIFSKKPSLDISSNLDTEKIIPDTPAFLDDLRKELDSLCLDKKFKNSNKIATKWLLDRELEGKHPHSDLKSAGLLNEYPCIDKLRNLINEQEECVGHMNGCIVNRYRFSSAHNRPHADDESYVNHAASICTFSLGSQRDFGIYSKEHSPKLLRTQTLKSGSVFIMQPGSQSCTKHKVFPLHDQLPPLQDTDSDSAGDIRYSISFRNIVPQYDNVRIIENEVNDHDHRPETTLIFGSSIAKKLDPSRLQGRTGKLVINLCVGGAKISDVSEHMDDFFAGKGDYFTTEGAVSRDKMNIKNLIICVGTNDVLNAHNAKDVNKLYIPIQQLLRKAKLLFNDSRVVFQSLIPIPTESDNVVKKVQTFNILARKICRSMSCIYMNVFDNFMQDKFVNLYRWNTRNNYLDIHPSNYGNSVLARRYISVIRGKFDMII